MHIKQIAQSHRTSKWHISYFQAQVFETTHSKPFLLQYYCLQGIQGLLFLKSLST